LGYLYSENNSTAGILEQQIKQQGLSIRSVAKNAGVSYSHLSKVIKQEVPTPKPDYLDKLALPLRLPFCMLFVSAGYFDNFSLDPQYVTCSWQVEHVFDDHVDFLSSYLAFRNVEYTIALPSVTDKADASTLWFANFQATQNHRQKCDMLISLLERNHLSDYIDEAFVFFDLVPSRFVNPKFTPNFADTVDTIKRSLTRTIQEMIDMEEEQSEKQSLDNIWPIYERNLAEIRKEKLKQEELRKNAKPEFAFDEIENTGLKIVIQPDARLFVRIDFQADISKLDLLVEKYKELIQEVGYKR
jgi:transcriptional regulator with XRE-family HTH domain